MAESIRVLIPEKDVAARIEEMGRQISEDYEGKQVHLICVLKGGVFFITCWIISPVQDQGLGAGTREFLSLFSLLDSPVVLSLSL